MRILRPRKSSGLPLGVPWATTWLNLMTMGCCADAGSAKASAAAAADARRARRFMVFLRGGPNLAILDMLSEWFLTRRLQWRKESVNKAGLRLDAERFADRLGHAAVRGAGPLLEQHLAGRGHDQHRRGARAVVFAGDERGPQAPLPFEAH